MLSYRILVAIVAVLACLAAPAAPALAAPDRDRTLSPYLFVRDGDPAIDALPLEATEVDFTIVGVIADVRVRQSYKNAGTRPINAEYVFPASTRAAVHGMRMIVGGRMVEAEIRERKQAKREYEQAKKQGKNAALLEQDRPNVFRMSVANVMPGDRIEVELDYTELLVPTDGQYEFVYPTVVGPRYSNRPASAQPETGSFVETPYCGEGQPPAATLSIRGRLSTGMPLLDVDSRTHALDLERSSLDAAHVWVDEAEGPIGDRDFVLSYRLADRRVASGLMLHAGDDENYFLLMVEPPPRPTAAQIPPREYVFVLDVSGSMHDFPLDTAKTLLRDLVGGLRPTDNFNVVLFAGRASIMAPRSLPATEQNLREAMRVIDDRRGSGGTELMRALETAMQLPQDEGWSRSIVVVTDGYVACEQEAFRYIRDNLGEANVFAFGIGSSVNRFLIRGIARAGLGEPFVVTRPEDAADAASRFREYVESPVLTDIRLEADGFEIYDVEPPSIPDVLADRPVIVHGKWRGKPEGTLTLTGVSGDGSYRNAFDVGRVNPGRASDALRYLWARRRIADLSDFNFGSIGEKDKAEVTALGLRHNLMTRYTSFIAVEKTIRNVDGDAKDVRQPLPLPRGVTERALSMGKGSEPSLLLLGLAIGGLLTVLRFLLPGPR